MAKEKKKLPWQDVDPDSVKGDKLFMEYKTAQKAAGEKRAAFESAFIEAARKKKHITADETLRFSYNFGKLSVAKDKVDEPKVQSGGTFKL